jgi:peptidylprolyl isomerase
VRRRLLALSLVSMMLLGSAACGDDTADPAAGPSSAGGGIEGLTVTGKVGESLDVKVDGPIETDEPQAEIVTAGNGAPVEAGQAALLHLYIGNGTSGKAGISTYDQGQPVQVTMTEDQLFKVLLDQLVGQPSGSRIAVAAPVKDIWGKQGAPQLQLKAKDTAVLVADIISAPPAEVLDGPQGSPVDPPADAPKVVEEDGTVVGFDWSDAPKKAPKELTVVPLVEGDGPEAKAGSLVTFDYFGAVWGEKKPFDESYSSEPVPFGVGIGGLIPAWDKTIPGLTRGSRVLIIAPPDQAYGDQERPGIPANSTLVFVVDVLGVDA